MFPFYKILASTVCDPLLIQNTDPRVEPHYLRVQIGKTFIPLVLNFLRPLEGKINQSPSQSQYLDSFKSYQKALKLDPATAAPDWLSRLNQQAESMISDDLADGLIQLNAHRLDDRTTQRIYKDALTLLKTYRSAPQSLSSQDKESLKLLTLLVACASIEGKFDRQESISDNPILNGLLAKEAPLFVEQARQGIKAKVRESHFGLLIALSYPNHPDLSQSDALRVVASLFIDDDVTDNSASPLFLNPSLRKAVNDLFFSIINGSKELTQETQEIIESIKSSQSPYFLWLNPIATLFGEVHSILSTLKKDTSDYLNTEISNYFEYVEKMVANRLSIETPGTLFSYQEQVTARVYTGAVFIQIILGFALLDLSIPPRINLNASYKNAFFHASMASNFSNDILGFGKDPASDNLVSGLKTLGLAPLLQSLGQDPSIEMDINEAALRVAAQSHNAHINSLLVALDELGNKDEDKDTIQPICSAIYAACNAISHWQENSGRYPGFLNGATSL